jgi:hypothetical protein
MAFLQEYKETLSTNVIAGSGGHEGGDPIEADGTVAEAGEAILGVAFGPAAATERNKILVVGECKLKGGAAIAVGASIEVGSSSKFITLASGVKVGKALTECTGDGAYFTALINCI